VESSPAVGLLQILQQIPDPRGRKGRRHPLSAMLAAIICSLLSGIRSLDGIADWTRFQPPALWHLLGFTRKPPTANCFRDVLIALDPETLEAVLGDWIDSHLDVELGEAIAIDGKVLRGTLSAHRRSVTLLAALDTATGGVLAQTAVPEATNEHKAALTLLQTLMLKGRIVTGDAAFCQRDVCEQITKAGGEYVLPVKDNQPDLKRRIAQEFIAADAAFSPLPAAIAG
jgi:hypothetical protein